MDPIIAGDMESIERQQRWTWNWGWCTTLDEKYPKSSNLIMFFLIIFPVILPSLNIRIMTLVYTFCSVVVTFSRCSWFPPLPESSLWETAYQLLLFFSLSFFSWLKRQLRIIIADAGTVQVNLMAILPCGGTCMPQLGTRTHLMFRSPSRQVLACCFTDKSQVFPFG